jgi:phenylacetate-coenzyme A ligase PaaK-like adenylate-forming protein
MRFDFSKLPLKNRAFSEKPMTFIDQAPKNFLAAIIDLVAIETGNRTAREYWQQKQLQNLLQHAAQRSAFWRERIGTNKINDINLSRLPILTRSEVVKQVAAEGSLLPPGERIRTMKHSTSGSSGTPVHFFISEMNTEYNAVRSAAQYFMEGRDLTLNRTRFRAEPMSNQNGFTVEKQDGWLGSLGPLVRCGINKHIEYFRPNINVLCKEMERDSIGYLVSPPHFIEAMLQHIDPDFLKRTGTAIFIPFGNTVSPELREAFSSAGIPVRGSYSSEETGVIGSECERVPGTYHVATSNVIVEVISDESLQLRDKRVGRVLVTHLHSYATPFIRYDLGDVATLDRICPCGHDGPVLSNIYGRTKTLLKHADGHVSYFYPRGKELAAIAEFDEYRIRQTDIKTIVVEIGGRDSLTPEETAAFIALIKLHAGDEFDVEVKAVARIDWSHSIKRLGFHSDVL